MDIKELDKKQLILLTLLITFVVSIATGIVTVSLMKQMPKSVPQTINNVIQRTIEKVTTVQVPAPITDTGSTNKTSDAVATTSSQNDLTLLDSNSEVVIPIYLSGTDTSDTTGDLEEASTEGTDENIVDSLAVGQGVLISDIGLILVDSNIISTSESYKVILNEIDFNVSILKRFDNGFTILKISPITKKTDAGTDTTDQTQ